MAALPWACQKTASYCAAAAAEAVEALLEGHSKVAAVQ